MKMTSTGKDYVLMTAARNEAAYIEGTIKAVLSQTVKPRLWVIVSDGSTDGTDEIIREYEKNEGFLVYLRRHDPSSQVDFRRKVESLRLSQAMFNNLSYDFIGNLDADITFHADYFEILLHEFNKKPGLGIAGGVLYEPFNGRFVPRYLSEKRYVPGAVQLFRRQCYEQVGGYVGLRWGGGRHCGRGFGLDEGVGDAIHSRFAGIPSQGGLRNGFGTSLAFLRGVDVLLLGK